MKTKSLRITKTFDLDTERDDPIWAIYIQRGKYRYYHLPTQGRRDLKALVGRLNAKGVELNLTDETIWKRVDKSCGGCSGYGQWFREIENGVPKFMGQCARCNGKGHVTVSDDRRFETWLAHKCAAAA